MLLTYILVVESDVPGSSQIMVPMSEYDSTVFNEGYLATTLDRKDKNDQSCSKETSFLNGMLLTDKCMHS